MPDISSSTPIAALRRSIDALALEIALRDLSSLERIEAPPATASLNQDPEVVGDFILESREHLYAIEGQLLALEQDPGNLQAINAIFRGFHTIKGLPGFLDLPAIQRFAHEVETLLDLARNSNVAVDSGLIDIILQSADQ
jgi:two-component system chemotaxis sensor kinase CheA